MGHGDTIVLADANFPSESYAKHMKVVRCDGLGIPDLLDAILQVIPLDRYVPQPATLMEVVPGDPVETPIWNDYEALLLKHEKLQTGDIRHLERFRFYDECKKAYAVVATGEKALYANVILQKGVI